MKRRGSYCESNDSWSSSSSENSADERAHASRARSLMNEIKSGNVKNLFELSDDAKNVEALIEARREELKSELKNLGTSKTFKQSRQNLKKMFESNISGLKDLNELKRDNINEVETLQNPNIKPNQKNQTNEIVRKIISGEVKDEKTINEKIKEINPPVTPPNELQSDPVALSRTPNYALNI